MSKDGIERSRICPWCGRVFFDRHAVDQHAIRKHPRGFVRTEEAIQRGKLQAYHQQRKRGVIVEPAGPKHGTVIVEDGR